VTEYARPEAELLLRCAAPPGNGKHAERIRTLAGQTLDWDHVLHMAAVHAVTPLLYWALKAVRPESVPAALERRFQQNTQNSVHLTSELFQVMSLFASEGIPVLPFKGPTLAVTAYGNLALRRFSDLDLLVPREDALRAREILLQNGYSSDLQLNANWAAAYMRAYDEFGLRGPGGQPLIELHWAVTPRYFSVPLDIGPFWDRAVTVNLGGKEVATLCADDMLLVLCVHATKHCWSHLSMVSDIAWLMAARNIAWDEVLERARRLGSLRMVLLGLTLAGTLLDIPLPEPVVRGGTADRSVQHLAAQVKERMLQAGSLEKSIVAAGLFHMSARERYGDRVRYFVRLASTVGVEDREFVNLPASLAFLYPVMRFPRLVRKYWMRIP
jgi:hypothetical protein